MNKFKLYLSVIAFIFGIYTEGSSQVAITTDGSTPDAKAMLDIKSPAAGKGLLIPRVSTATRLAMVAPNPEGLLVYDLGTHSMWQWNAALATPAWLEVSQTTTGLIYYPSRTALVFNNATRPDAQIGINSTALGTAIALGNYSLASGSGSNASGLSSVALGASIASGIGSVAIGGDSNASGAYSTAFDGGLATASDAFAVGFGSVASGDYSTALGASTASGYASTASGHGSTASSNYSTALGASTASGLYSTASGYASTASGHGSTASGFNSVASGYASTTIGNNITSKSAYCTVIGKSNDPIVGTAQGDVWNTTDPIFMIGNGTTSGNNAFVVFKNGTATLNGSLILTSDRRLKRDITPLSNALDKVLKINGMHYYWKDTTTHDSRLQAGVIAQEVQAVMPELVNTDPKGMLSVNYQGMTPYLIESIKQLKKENDDLKQQIATLNTLKADVEALKAALQSNDERKKGLPEGKSGQAISISPQKAETERK
jgi:hypothetical protein